MDFLVLILMAWLWISPRSLARFIKDQTQVFREEWYSIGADHD
jgi:hypothetical protein